ncbi:MAG TPA: GNAT family N-acetyltransferase [Dokdonella sp.]|uniref:GNAT family N-acetyltransferase n=1 Tax=Dokdonella sp. TaxID=2291710 RepID=UPI002D7F236A|nr:GNAT family N-acetyltransferase [Dokdonella sp.]HET9032688.1 GNAT family N-acetyltransferase [Dokdonella sp.]
MPTNTNPPPFQLETERLTLRELTPNDAAFMLALLNDADFIRHIADRGVRTLEQARQYIVDGAMASYREHGFGLWGVVPDGMEDCVGICGLIRRASLDDVDIGYGFLPEARGKGYALEASRACMDFGRGRLGLRRIIAITSQDNLPSARLLEKIGLRFERLIRLADDAEELRLYAWVA